jgi:hypothetical protein
MKPPPADICLIAVIGDVHHHIGLAAEGLVRIEQELGQPVAQVFSVGDLGLFLDESDWDFLTGPKKYRKPDDSPKIRAAWKSWHRPLSAIAGNHEPLHRGVMKVIEDAFFWGENHPGVLGEPGEG